MNREAQILQALPLATAAEQRRLVAELTSIRQAAARRVQASREIELGDHIASAHLTPAPTYVRHSSDTNWLGEVTGTRQSPAQIHQAAKHEAAAWFRQTLPVARADKGELRRQAVGYAQAWSGQFLDRSGEAAEAFLQAAFHHAGLKLAKEIGYEDDDDYDADAEAPKEDDNDNEAEDDDDYFGPKKESRRRTASISMDDVQHWCDQNGCVMMDFPEELIESVVQSGDLEQLGSYLEDIDAGQIGQDGRDWDYGQSESASYGWTGSRRTAGEYYDDLGPGFTQNSFPQSEKREVARWSTKGGKMTLVLTHGQYGYDYDVFDRQWSSPRSSGSVNGSSDQEAIAEIEAQMARGWHDKGLSRVSTRRTAGEGMTCSVCGDKMASTDGSHHHDNGEKHDHEAKPGGDSKESARRTAAEAYDWRNWVGHAYMGFPGSKIISITPSEDYLMNGPRGTGPGHQAPATMVLQDGDRQLTIPIDLATAHRQVLGARRTALKCSCAHNNDGSVTTFLCPLHADDDPCATMASVTGGRRKGSIINGVCSNCGWTSDRTASKTAARRTSSLFDDADAAYLREDRAWFYALSMDDLVTLWNAVSGENFLSGVQTYGWDDEVSDALYAKGYDFGVTASRRTASTGQIVRDSGWSAPLKSLDGESQPRTRTLSVDALGQGKGNMLVTMSWFWPDYEIRVDPYPGAVVAKGQTASLGIIESAAMDWIKKNVTAEWYSSEREKAIAQYASRKQATDGPSEQSQNGYGESSLDQIEPGDAPENTNMGWISEGDPDADNAPNGSDAAITAMLQFDPFAASHRTAIDGPSEQSQNGYGESALDQIEVATAPEDTNLGWITDGDANADPEDSFDRVTARTAVLDGFLYSDALASAVSKPGTAPAYRDAILAALKTADESLAIEMWNAYINAEDENNRSEASMANVAASAVVDLLIKRNMKRSRRQAAESNDRPAGAAPMVDHTSDDPGYDHDMFGGEWVYEGEFGDGQPNSGDSSKPSINATGSLVDDFDMFAPLVTKTAMPAPADHGVDIGDIFYCSWGYDQTNIDFYEVVGLTPAGMKVRPIGKRFVSQNGPGGNKVVAVPGNFTGESMTKRLQLTTWREPAEPTFSVNSYSSAYLWDGTPMYETDSQFGH